jgi:hypothetical protein
MAKRQNQQQHEDSSPRRDMASGFRVPWFFFADKDIPHAEKMAIVQSATEAIMHELARGWSYEIPIVTRQGGTESMHFYLKPDNDNNWYLGRRYVRTYVRTRLNLV